MDFTGNYIAGLNSWHQHFDGDQSAVVPTYVNNMEVALPITTYVVVNPRVDSSTQPSDEQYTPRVVRVGGGREPLSALNGIYTAYKRGPVFQSYTDGNGHYLQYFDHFAMHYGAQGWVVTSTEQLPEITEADLYMVHSFAAYAEVIAKWWDKCVVENELVCSKSLVLYDTDNGRPSKSATPACQSYSDKIYVVDVDDPAYEGFTLSDITRAVLQYRVLRNNSWLTGGWTTVRDIVNPKWKLETDHPTPIFGTASVDPVDDGVPLRQGDVIVLRYYVTDGIVESGDLNDPLEDYRPFNTESEAVYGGYTGGWSPPFVMSVVYNGKRRIGY